MSEAEVVALLREAKPLAQTLIRTDGLYKLDEADMYLLKRIGRALQADQLQEDTTIRAAGLTLYEVALLVGTLSIHNKGIILKSDHLSPFYPSQAAIQSIGEALPSSNDFATPLNAD